MNNIQKLVLFFFYLIIMYVFIHTYIYLNQLNTCDCFNKNDKYFVNIEYMKFFQILEIFIFTIYVGFMFFVNNKFKKINKSVNNTLLPAKFIASISLTLLLAISLYMAYNVLGLYTNIKEDCACANSFYKYFVYYQGIVSISSVLRVFSIVIMIAIIFLFNSLK